MNYETRKALIILELSTIKYKKCLQTNTVLDEKY